MGLDAHVRCDCAKNGKARPFPFPNKLGFHDCGEPQYSDGGLTAEQLLECDRWSDDWGYEHHGYLLKARIGNVSFVAFVRHRIELAKQENIDQFRVLLTRVLYDGTHAGDCLTSEDARFALAELEALESLENDALVRGFASTMRKLCEASIGSGNPIQF